MRTINTLYTYLSDILKRYADSNATIENLKKQIQEIDDTIQNPNIIKDNDLLEYLRLKVGTSLTKEDFLRISSLVGYYNPNSNVPQIKETYDLIIKELNERKDYLQKDIDKNEERIIDYSLKEGTLDRCIQLLRIYHDEQYLTNEEMDTIRDAIEIAVKEKKPSEEIEKAIRDFYLLVAKNNSRIEEDLRPIYLQQRREELEEQKRRRLEEAKEELNNQMVVDVKIMTLKEGLMSLEIINNEEFINDLEEELRNKVTKLKEFYLKCIDDLEECSKDFKKDVTFILNQDLPLEELLELNGNTSNQYIVSTILTMFEVNKLIKNNSIDNINQVIKTGLKDAVFELDNDSFCTLFDALEYKELLDKSDYLVDLYDITGTKKQDLDNALSYSKDFSPSDKIKLLDEKELLDTFYQTQILEYSTSLKEYISVLNEEELSEFAGEITDYLTNFINSYEEYRFKKGDNDTSIDDLRELNDDPYGNSALNYLYFIDEDLLLGKISEYSEIKNQEVMSKLNFLITADKGTLFKAGSGTNSGTAVSKLIKIAENTQNPWGVRELKAGGKVTRLGFKCCDDNIKVNGKNIICVISIARAKLNDNQKERELHAMVYDFRDREDIYNDAMDKFSKFDEVMAKNQEQLSDEEKEIKKFVIKTITDGLETMKKIDDNPPSNGYKKKRGGV